MIEIGSNSLGILNPSGLVHVGEGYYNNLSIYQSLEGDFKADGSGFSPSPSESPYIIRTSISASLTYFPNTIRILNNDGKTISIQQYDSSGIYNIYSDEDFNLFLSNIQGYTLVGSPAWPKSSFSYVGVRYPNSDIPQARDALAYNLIYKNQTIPNLNTWRWFKVSNTPIASGIFGACTGPRARSRNENYDGYYTNIYNTLPNDNEIWLYNYSTPHTVTLISATGGPTQYLGGVTWLISGRPNVYKNDGREIYWLVTGYNFEKNWENTIFFNKLTNSGELLDPSSNLGLPYPNSKFLDIKNIPPIVNYSSNAYPSARFLWSGSINRWVFNLRAQNCSVNPSVNAYITGLNSGEYPWTTSWPSGVNLILLN